MLLQGSFKIPADEEKVWNFVSDLGRVVECVPGIQSYTIAEGKRRVSASVRVSIGLIRGTFQTNGRIVSEDPGARAATIELTGSGAGSGFSALVTLKLATTAKETELGWNASVNVNGPLGSLAKPLIEGSVKRIVDQMFDCVRRKLT